MKKIILIVIALLAISGIYRTTTAVIEHIRYVRSLEDSKSQLESTNNTLSTALQLSENARSAMLTENERIKALEKEYQRKTAELNANLIKQREESQNEITRLENALRRAGINDVRVPDDVIRMQRERAKAINQRASENYRRSHQQAAGNLIDYSPCLVPEDTPVLLNKYPTYAEQLFSTIDECNQRNALNNQRNREIWEGKGRQ